MKSNIFTFNERLYENLEDYKYDKLRYFFHLPRVVKSNIVNMLKLNTNLLSIVEVIGIIKDYIEVNKLRKFEMNKRIIVCDEQLSYILNETYFEEYKLTELVIKNTFSKD